MTQKIDEKTSAVKKFAVGDTIVHWTHGLGVVTAIEAMELAGESQQYYVIEVAPLKLWVPIGEAHDGTIRFPTDKNQFDSLFEILRTPGRKLSDQQYQRKIDLRERMQKSTPEVLCQVIRDLSDRARSHTLNQNDSAVLFRAEEQLLDEWVLSLGVERTDALQELESLLQADLSETK